MEIRPLIDLREISLGKFTQILNGKLSYSLDHSIIFKDSILLSNFIMIDSILPNLILELTKLDNVEQPNMTEAISILIERNPLNYNLSMGHNFYDHKIKALLIACLMGDISNISWLERSKRAPTLFVDEHGALNYFESNRQKVETFIADNSFFSYQTESIDSMNREISFNIRLGGKP